MSGKRWTRRAFLRNVALAGAGSLAGCGGDDTAALRERAREIGNGLDCSDVSGLWPAEVATRIENQYRQDSEYPDRFCLNCLNFVPAPQPRSCATCKTVRGPIHPAGWCRQWTPARS